jgi:hypothetical protein
LQPNHAARQAGAGNSDSQRGRTEQGHEFAY